MYEAIHYLREIDPRLPYLLIAALVGMLIWLWRQIHPASFDRLPPRFKALPAALVGLILGATTTEGLTSLVIDLVAGTFAGVAAVGAHETARRLKDGTGHPRGGPGRGAGGGSTPPSSSEFNSGHQHPALRPPAMTDSHTRKREGGQFNGS